MAAGPEAGAGACTVLLAVELVGVDWMAAVGGGAACVAGIVAAAVTCAADETGEAAGRGVAGLGGAAKSVLDDALTEVLPEAVTGAEGAEVTGAVAVAAFGGLDEAAAAGACAGPVGRLTEGAATLGPGFAPAIWSRFSGAMLPSNVSWGVLRRALGSTCKALP